MAKVQLKVSSAPKAVAAHAAKKGELGRLHGHCMHL